MSTTNNITPDLTDLNANSRDQATILVIDDEPDNFDVIESILNSQPYHLHYASGGQVALDILEVCQPDLILLDVMMPEIDGIAVCKSIKGQLRWRNVPIIIVTALTAKEDLAQCLAVGADDFISKPLNSLELRARIKSMLRIKKQYDALQRFSLLQRDTINILGQNLHELTGNLASKLSHELNTPLNGIIGVIELLRQNIDTMAMAEIKETLSWADESAQLLFSLTKKFRTYLQLEILATEGKTFSHECTEFESDLIISELKPYFDKLERSADLVCEIEDGDICLSEHYLSILLRELVDNALKFSKPGTKIHINSAANGNMMEITIHDYGWGMTAQQIARIDALVQFERQTYAQDGTGMGLKIVQRIVELAGGQFKITSVYQKETQIQVTIPLAVVVSI